MKTPTCTAILAGACVVVSMAHTGAYAQGTATESLREFVETALSTHPDVEAVNAGVRKADALAQSAARPLYNPELELEYENTEVTERTLGFSQAIDWNNKRSARSQAGSATAMAVAAEAQSLRESFIGSVLGALSSHGTLSELAELADRRLELMARFQAIAEERQRAGDLPRVDLDLAILAATQAKFERARSASRLAEARENVRSLAAPTISGIPTLPESLPPTPQLGDRTETLPAIRAARFRLESAVAELDLARRERRPDPVLSARAGKEGNDNLLGVSITVPLFVRNNFSHEVVAAEADRAGSAAEFDSQIRAHEAKLARIHARYQEMRLAWTDWEAAGQISLGRQVETLERLWRAGEINTSDYLIQITQSLQTQSSATELKGELWQAWIDWLTASATGASWLGIEQ